MNFIKQITPKGWIIITIVILVIVLIIMYFKNKNKTTTTTIKTQNNNTTTSYSQPVFPLVYGSTGNEVKKVQTYLNTKYGEKLVVDGIWGALTQAAVAKNLGLSGITKTYYDTNIA